MDTIVMIMFGAVLTMTTALTFFEVRRIRKRLEAQGSGSAVEAKASASTVRV